MAATNKCLAQSNKSRTGCEATKKRESSVSLQEKSDDKRRASGRSDLPSDDVGLHRRRRGLRRDRVTPCEAIYEVKQNDAVKHRWHAFLARGNSATARRRSKVATATSPGRPGRRSTELQQEVSTAAPVPSGGPHQSRTFNESKNHDSNSSRHDRRRAREPGERRRRD